MKHFCTIYRVCLDRGFGLQVSGWLGALILLFVVAIPASAVQVRLRDGQEVRLSLHNVLTTENVVKDDTIDFDVSEDVVVNGRVVIAKGAPAQGKVLRVKGAGKKRAKDASVTFRFVSIHTVDNQVIPLRATPYKGKKKGDSKENEIEESSPIPGYAERVIGAEKGRTYPAFIDSAAVVNVHETAPAAVSIAPATTTAPAPAQPAQVAPSTTPQPATPPGVIPPVETEPASVEFDSNPAAADILLDGSFVGNTPSTLRVAGGRHVIEIRLRGYRGWTQTLMVVPGSHPRVKRILEKE